MSRSSVQMSKHSLLSDVEDAEFNASLVPADTTLQSRDRTAIRNETYSIASGTEDSKESRCNCSAILLCYCVISIVQGKFSAQVQKQHKAISIGYFNDVLVPRIRLHIIL